MPLLYGNKIKLKQLPFLAKADYCFWSTHLETRTRIHYLQGACSTGNTISCKRRIFALILEMDFSPVAVALVFLSFPMPKVVCMEG